MNITKTINYEDIKHILIKHIYYKSENYTFTFTEKNIRKKSIKRLLEKKLNFDYVNDINLKRIDDNTIIGYIDNIIVNKLKFINIVNDINGIFIKIKTIDFIYFFEDSIYEVKSYSHSNIILENNITESTLIIQFVDFSLITTQDKDIGLIFRGEIDSNDRNKKKDSIT